MTLGGQASRFWGAEVDGFDGLGWGSIQQVFLCRLQWPDAKAWKGHKQNTRVAWVMKLRQKLPTYFPKVLTSEELRRRCR